MGAGALSVSAMGSSQTWSATLPWMRNGVDIKSGTSSGDTRAQVTLSSIGGNYDSMWVLFRANDGGWKDVSGGNMNVYEGNSKEVPLNTNVSKGTYMMFVGGNNTLTYVNVSASGNVRFP